MGKSVERLDQKTDRGLMIIYSMRQKADQWESPPCGKIIQRNGRCRRINCSLTSINQWTCLSHILGFRFLIHIPFDRYRRRIRTKNPSPWNTPSFSLLCAALPPWCLALNPAGWSSRFSFGRIPPARRGHAISSTVIRHPTIHHVGPTTTPVHAAIYPTIPQPPTYAFRLAAFASQPTI